MDFYGLRPEKTLLAVAALVKGFIGEHMSPWLNLSRSMPPVQLMIAKKIQQINRTHLIVAGGFIAGGLGIRYMRGLCKARQEERKQQQQLQQQQQQLEMELQETVAMSEIAEGENGDLEDEHN